MKNHCFITEQAKKLAQTSSLCVCDGNIGMDTIHSDGENMFG